MTEAVNKHEYIEGAPAFYTRTGINGDDTFVVTIGGMPLLLGRPYSHRGDEKYKGLFSCGFSPEWESCVSEAMLWRFDIGSDGSVRLYNPGIGKYLKAIGKLTENGEECALDFDDGGTEFTVTNEGWLSFKTEDGEFYLSYLNSRSFHCPSDWTSSMTNMSDVKLYAVNQKTAGRCRIIIDDGDGEVTVKADGEAVESGMYVTIGAMITVTADVSAERRYTGYRANGHYYDKNEGFRIYKDTKISPEIKGGDGGYLSFISDVHDLPIRLDTWLRSLPSVIYLDRCVFGGDITAGNVKSIAAQQAAHAKVGAVVKKYSKKIPVITVGNHECEYDYRWENRSAEEIFTDSMRYGPTYDDDYVIYNLGAGEFCHDDFQSNFPDLVIDELEAWLKGAPSDKPVFINAHYPLHAIKTRPRPQGAGRVIEILNKYPNVIYLWGHNHGQHLETGYGRILSAGDEILYEYESGAKKTLNFTYCSHGAMYDAARTVAPHYGLVAKIEKDAVRLSYYDMSGKIAPYKRADGVGGEEFTLKIKE